MVSFVRGLNVFTNHSFGFFMNTLLSTKVYISLTIVLYQAKLVFSFKKGNQIVIPLTDSLPRSVLAKLT